MTKVVFKKPLAARPANAEISSEYYRNSLFTSRLYFPIHFYQRWIGYRCSNNGNYVVDIIMMAIQSCERCHES